MYYNFVQREEAEKAFVVALRVLVKAAAENGAGFYAMLGALTQCAHFISDEIVAHAKEGTT